MDNGLWLACWVCLDILLVLCVQKRISVIKITITKQDAIDTKRRNMAGFFAIIAYPVTTIVGLEDQPRKCNVRSLFFC